MQIRYSAAIGTPVVAEDEEDLVGTIGGILLHPDTGKVEGFFLQDRSFLSSGDILRWGARVSIARADVLGPIEERIRLQPLLHDPRPMLGQPIRSQSGRSFGRCQDLQFETNQFLLQWLFPKKLLRWGIPVPASQILEVRKDAIIVRDPAPPEEAREPAVGEEAPLLPSLPEAA